MNLSLIQLDITWEDRDANHTKAERLLAESKPARGSLIVLPEIFPVGFSMNVEMIAEERGGPTERFLTKLAKQHGVFIVGGVATKGANGKGRNEALCINDKGEVVARYCKMHPFSYSGENNHYEPGDSPVIFDWNGIKVAPVICYDLRFPELFRAATKRGAELFTVIANWPSPRIEHWKTLLAARALENQAYVVAVNRVGQDPKCQYNGQSRVIDPTGVVIADAGDGEKVISTAIDRAKLDDFRTRFAFLRDMRSDLVP